MSVQPLKSSVKTIVCIPVGTKIEVESVPQVPNGTTIPSIVTVELTKSAFETGTQSAPSPPQISETTSTVSVAKKSYALQSGM